MITQVLKTVLAGILAGVVLFMMPFIIIKVLIFFLLIKAIFRLMGGRRRYGHWRYAYAHKYQNMSEEERKAFMHYNAKNWASSRWGGNRCGWNSKWDSNNCGPDDCEPKNKEEDKTTNI